MAEERPLLCVVDDAQWLDRASAQVLAFAARRLLAEPVGLVFAAREPGEELRGLAEVEVRGLPDQDARALLRSAVGVRLDEQVLDRIVAETNGNPLALLELPRGLGPAQLAGGFGLPGAGRFRPGSSRVSGGGSRRCPRETRLLMLVAAAEPAATRCGVGGRPSGSGSRLGRARGGPGRRVAGDREPVRFRHPLVRSAVYPVSVAAGTAGGVPALAEVTDRDRDPDRRAWHLAAAAPGPDEEVAAELERSAGRAQARGGMAAAAAFLQRADDLTAEPVRRAGRALAAAQVSLRPARWMPRPAADHGGGGAAG